MIRNILSIDVEEYFHPAELEASVPMTQWDGMPSRVEAQTMRVLEILAETGTIATFFVLGWVAKRQPRLMRTITSAGHEIGSHSHLHRLVYNLTPREFWEDTMESVKAIEDACGARPRLYRAPSFSITERSMWALDVLIDCGFTHDSSIYPISHDRYGIPGFQRHSGSLARPTGSITEAPIATVRLIGGSVAPAGGGAYLRIFPYSYTAAALRRINHQEGEPACVYFHPWELDFEQPRLAHGVVARLRTYTGLRTFSAKLRHLLKDFAFTTVTAGCAARRAAAPEPNSGSSIIVASQAAAAGLPGAASPSAVRSSK